MIQLIPEARAIVLAARASLDPSPTELASGRARLIAALATAGAIAGTATTAASATTTSAASSAGAVTGSAALKLGAIAIVAGAAVGGGAVLTDRPSSPAPHVAPARQAAPMPAPDRPTVTPMPAVTPIESPPAPPASAPASATTSKARAPRAVPVPVPAPVPAPSTLAAEVALLDAAHRAIRAADYPAARAKLDEHLRRFPDGQLAAERARISRALPAPASPPSHDEGTTP